MVRKMDTSSETLLKAIFGAISRLSIPPEKLLEIVQTSASDKHVRAFNMCDGQSSQSEIAKSLKLDSGNFSRTVARWIDAGAVVRLGEGRDAKLLHAYPLPTSQSKKRGS
jgi:DNA-binding MarR family transcriptional regulator